MRTEYYEAIVARLQKEFSLTADRSEHPAITEFFEGPLPLFKLIIAQDEDLTTSLYVSYQIQLDIPSSIQWFMRLRNLDPNIVVAPSYIKDSEGNSYVGEDAEIILMYMVEQDVITAFVQSDKDAEDIVNKKALPQASPVKVYSNYKKALTEFKNLRKGKQDVSH